MMSTESSAAYVIAAVSAVGSSAVQATAPAPTVHPVVVPIVSAVIGGLMSFAVLKTTVRVVERDVNEMKADLKDIGTRLARIEGKMEANGE